MSRRLCRNRIFSSILFASALVLFTRTADAQDVTPPDVYINPLGGVHAFAADSIIVDFCDDTDLNMIWKNMTLNSNSVTSAFNSDGTGPYGCTVDARYAGVVSFVRGANTFSASIQDNAGNAGSTVYTYYFGVEVTPNDRIGKVRASTSQTMTFTVRNTSAESRTFTMTSSCTSTASCSGSGVSPGSLTIGPGGQKTATLTFTSGSLSTTGTVTVTATDGSNVASASQSVTSATTWVVPDFSMLNYEHNQTSLCAAWCFAATQSMSTVPYFSLGQPRSITLLYNSDAVAVRPIVSIDVSLASAADSLSEWWLEAKDSAGTTLTFVNGDTKLRFSALYPKTTKTRLAGQFDAAALGYTSGVYPITLIATAKYTSGSTEALSVATRFMVVNERKSAIARGWTVAGLSRIRAQGSDAFLTEGDGSGVLFTRLGGDVVGEFATPPGDYSRLSASGTGASLKYRRDFPDSSRAEYNQNGYLLRLISRTHDTTSLTYDGSNRLSQVADPYRTTAGSTHLYTTLAYTTAGLSSITEPGSNQTQAGGRITNITVGSSDSTLTGWQDPDNVTTSLSYDASKRLSSVTNRAGDVTTVKYNSTTWKLDSLISPSFAGDPRLYGAGSSKQLKTKFRPWQTIAVPTSSTVTTAFTSVKADTIRGATVEPGGQVTAWTVDRWGSALVTTELPGDALQRVTSKYRQPMSILTDSVRTHEGMLEIFEYDHTQVRKDSVAGLKAVFTHYSAYAVPDSVWDSGTIKTRFKHGARSRIDTVIVVGNGTTHKTSFAYDSRYRVTSTTDPSSHTTTFKYGNVFGNPDTTIAPGSRYSIVRYDGYGRDTASSTPGAAWTRKKLDKMNRDSVVIKESGTWVSAPDTTLFTYGEAAHQMTVRDAASNTYTFNYNALGITTQETDPAGNLDKYFVDAEGRVTTWRNRNNDSVFTTYDTLHRPLIKTIKDNSAVVRADTFSYQAAGQWMAAKNKYSRDTVFFDATGFTTKVMSTLETGSWGKTVTRQYIKDTKGRLDSIHITLGSLAATGRKYVYDTHTGALTGARVNGSGPTIGLNGELLPSTVALPGGITDTISNLSIHDPYRQAFTSATLNDAFWRSTNVDERGRIDIVYKASNGTGNTEQRNLFYDARNRLRRLVDSIQLTSTIPCEASPTEDMGASLCTPGLPPTFVRRDSLDYDRLGNITRVMHSDSASGGPSSGTPTYNKNRILTWPGLTFARDSAGSITVRKKTGTDSTIYSWSVDGLLETVTAGGRVINYDYNAFGQLVRRRVAGGWRHFSWDRDNLLAELDSAQTNRRSEYAHHPGLDQPFAMLTGATSVTATRFILMDQSDNVMGLTTSAGAVDHYVSFTRPWGEQTGWQPNSNLVDTLRVGWKGLLWEADSTKLFYMRARWYDPITHRFLSQDPIGIAGGSNRYTFAGNDPVNRRDPTGTCPPGEELWVAFTRNLRTGAIIDVLGYFCGPGTDFPSGGGSAGDVPTWTYYRPVRPNECPLVPTHPTASVNDNMTISGIARKLRPWSKLQWFRGMVNTNQPWDYKDGNETHENLGNFNYGATGTTLGYSEHWLLLFSGAQSWASRRKGGASIYLGAAVQGARYLLAGRPSERFNFDDKVDMANIQAGIQYARNGCNR